jgi:hypothetical protein
MLWKAADVVFEVQRGGHLFGPRSVLNLSPLVSCSPLHPTAPGSSEGRQRCSTGRRRCASCFLPKTWLQGIFCSNFAWTVGDFPACQRVWCGECYTSSPLVSFHIRTVTDKQDGNDDDTFHQARLQQAWKGKHRAKDNFLVGRNGDHTLLSFECDLCIFRKLKGRIPDPDSNMDALCQAAVRRVNLDAMWARSKHTAQGQRDMLNQGLRYSKLAGLEGPYWYEGLLPAHDHCGYKVAIQMVLKSRAPAKHSQNYTQFDTIGKLRSVSSGRPLKRTDS